MNNTLQNRLQIQSEIYARGIGTYRGHIVELAVGEGLWLTGVSLRSGVLCQTEELSDMLDFLDRRCDGF